METSHDCRSYSDQSPVPWWLILIEGIAVLSWRTLVDFAGASGHHDDLLGRALSPAFSTRCRSPTTAAVLSMLIGILGIISGLLSSSTPWSTVVVGGRGLCSALGRDDGIPTYQGLPG
jgi:hypothetical protein